MNPSQGAVFRDERRDPVPVAASDPVGNKTGEKTCRRCGKTKEAGSFRRNARMRDGLSSWCSDCHAEAKRDSRRKQRVEALLAEAVELEGRANEGGLLAASSRSTAAALRRQAERELAA